MSQVVNEESPWFQRIELEPVRPLPGGDRIKEVVWVEVAQRETEPEG